MPELPQVEALARFLGKQLAGTTLTHAEVVSISALKTFEHDPADLIGHPIGAVVRHGKFVDVAVPPLHLVFHLARAGWLVWHEQRPTRRPRGRAGHLAVRIGVDSGAGFDLIEAGTQHRLAAYIVESPQQVPGVAALGIDPLSPQFTLAVLAGLLSSAGRAQLKGVLRNQGVIAGIGNAYSDEILHAARLGPFTPAASLDGRRCEDLYRAIREVLLEALASARDQSPDKLKAGKRATLRIHGRTGEPCPVCATPIAEVSFADSSLQYCPHCQTGDRVLADRRMSRLLT
ncbi:formamidopyrimidine-DNA glycosylase [Propionibacterium cyclohexanicum]|uniref:Formamidopyrimidine-DNA glycosylase n=1 Tax=Propionibacterium cyclohexanicum TaxID=64702 RepID=A0A1H9SF18_9ACTN|nr:DNA-formamidopyrimidine glycosylase family protein [Propionibacterium cyclohexanicum]SER83498.1 formamidopyrimidine-DNA glycosylase [Propionibacterium cyclohexanicum]